MPHAAAEQTGAIFTQHPSDLLIGVDVGGTFTDLVAFDPSSGGLSVVKIPSTPPDFHRAVIDAAYQATGGSPPSNIVHGSTVATNALLQRTGEPVAFITTEGFRDLLLIGRQNRPELYALHVSRPRPLTPEENWFTLRERISAAGDVVEPIQPAELDQLVRTIVGRGLKHVAVCLLFSFVNPVHEKQIADRCRAAGLTVSLSSGILPEFREYERASTTVINAALRPTVEHYLAALSTGLSGTAPNREHSGSAGGRASTDDPSTSSYATKTQPEFRPREDDDNPWERPSGVSALRIMHSAGGTLTPEQAAASAARLVLSGPAGGVMGAAFIAESVGFRDVITYDMGGTSTDVAAIQNGQPQWTTQGTVDGLPIGLPAFDIVTVGAGGGSIAHLDAGGALRVGPKSAGAIPGPACYQRGGTEPTVTDANLVLGRILPDQFAGGSMTIDPGLARAAIEPLARAMGKSIQEAALGILRVAEQNMSRAIRAVTSQRGLDPRGFALLSFGGAGGLHACALAESLEMSTVIVPPYAGVLSALGMVVAPAVADASKTVVQMGEALDDHRMVAEFGYLNLIASEQVPPAQTAAVEAYADVRFKGQSHELTVRVLRPEWETISAAFLEAYAARYGPAPEGRPIEIVTLRMRRVGRRPAVQLPTVNASAPTDAVIELVDAGGMQVAAKVVSRRELIGRRMEGPVLLIDREATAYVPAGWVADGNQDGVVRLNRTSAD